MCVGSSPDPAPPPAPAPLPPPLPESEPLRPVVGDEAKRKSKNDELGRKRRGRSDLRIDLGVGGSPDANKASGLVIS